MKGYTKTVPLEILSKFLDTEYTKTLVHTKWFKYINESKINVDNKCDFKIKVTDLKRNLIYKNNVLTGTSSLKLKLLI